MTPGAADQKESAEFFTAREPYQRLSERADVLVYQTEPLEEPVEVTGRVAVELCDLLERASTPTSPRSSSTSTRRTRTIRTATTCSSTTRSSACRFREGFDREVLMEPGDDRTR